MRRAALALLLALAARPAGARDIAADAFGPPTLDGVATGLRGGVPGLVPYIFEGGRDWPALRFRASRPLDWRGAGGVAVPVDNPAAEPVTVLLRLDDSPDADGGDRSLTGVATLPPHAHVTLLLPLDGGGPPGMRGRPPTGLVPGPGDLLMPDIRGTVDLGHVVALHVSGVRDAANRTLLIGTPSLRDAPARPPDGPLADAYGQAVAGRWPEKVDSDGMLRERLADAAAATRRQATELPRTFAPDGGIVGTTLRATGFFRVQKGASRWMLVTPQGHPFFSLGVDAVSPHNTTIVAGRRALFADLPAPGTPLGRHFGDDAGRATFDVGAANLERGLGPDWRRRWQANVIDRLRAWGFNTLGTWSDPALATALPHVDFDDVEGDSAMVPMGDRALPDPFDPRFPSVADGVAAAVAARHRGDRTLIGSFSGNELPWGEPGKPADGILAHVLAGPQNSPARQALLADLKARYGTPAALSAAWGLPPIPGWDAAIPWPARPTAAALADRDAFEGRFAERYFATVSAAFRRHDPDHLYLGTRFAAATPAIVRACARFCDVLTFNVYGRTPEEAAGLWRGLDRPVLIGEFHFGSLDRGSFWPGMVAVPSEADRGPAYAAYVAAAVADPAIVGCHWYQYADETLTGRPYDGENGHIGLVAVTDVPFAGFVTAVTEANLRAATAFARQVAPDGR